jgi:nitroreductase
MKKGSDIRKSEYPVDKIFLDRWSSRAMSGEALEDKELMSLFEAAKWAPSSSNIQPWRFIYAKKDSEHWEKFFNTLVEFNQLWCKNASVLVCLIAKKTDDKGDENRNALSDSGAAWENLALQGSLNNLVIHGMAGFDIKKAREVLEVPDDYEVVHMFAIGKPASPEVLPERMQKSESPSSRKTISEIVFEGEFRG